MAEALGGSLLTAVLRRERAISIGALLAVIVLCWAYLITGAGMAAHEMDGMGMAMPATMEPWPAERTFVLLVMWSVMMGAMMLPSAAPMILFYGTVTRARSNPAAGTAAFAAGYSAAWIVFSLGAVALQLALERSGLLSPMMQTTSTALAGALLIAAGIYQWTPLKQACLRRCRSPLEFMMAHWRDGTAGAFVMGTRHGVYCLGCCGMLMLLLFVGGIMSLAWIAGLAAFVLIEKLAPAGRWTSRGAGALLVIWGAAMLIA